MQLLDIDLTYNRIHITLAETFDESEAKALLMEVESRLEELKNGFIVLCNLTLLKKFDHEARKDFRRLMDLCNERGVGKVIRIVPGPLDDFGLTVLSHFHYDNGIPIVTCQSFGEAYKHLHHT